MTILRSGSNSKYSSNWAKAFGGSAKPQTAEGKAKTGKAPVKATAKNAKPKSPNKK